MSSTLLNYYKENKGNVVSFLLTYAMIFSNIAIQLSNIEESSLKYYVIPVNLFLIVGYSYIIHRELKVKMLLKIAITYLVYLLVAGFLKASLNLANEEFVVSEFHHYLQSNFLLTTGLIVILTLVLNYFFYDKHRNEMNISGENKEYIILSQFFTMFMMTGELMIDRFLTNNFVPVKDLYLYENLFGFFFYSIVYYIFYALISYQFFKVIENLKNNKVNLLSSLLVSFILGLITNYYLQAGITEFWSWYSSYQVSGAMQFQVMIFTSLYMTIFVLMNRFLPALFINIITGATLCYVNYEKFAQRNEPLLIGDFSWIKDIVFFKDYINWGIATPLIILAIAVVVFLYWSRKKILPGQIANLKQRGMTLSVILAMLMTTVVTLKNNEDGEIVESIPVISSVYNRFTKPWLGINASAKYQSLTFLWFKQMTSNLMETPENYSEATIKELYEKYMGVADEINETRENNLSDQTVIYILSESFADPDLIEAVNMSEDPIPNIRALKTETTSGLMKSDGYGGGTANMEFQTLFGLPMYNFNNTISILNNEVFPKMSYLPAISNNFDPENRIAIHLNNANNYSRTSVYSSLDFEKFIATSGGTENLTDVQTFGNNYSDEATYDIVLSELKEGESQFFSVLTIQNHGPWGLTDSTMIMAEGEGFSDEENSKLTNYVRLLKETDDATLEFLNKLKEYDQDITVVFYGDHLPSLYPQSAFEKNSEYQYLADYFIWSNHSENKLDYPTVNSSDFPAAMLAHTNSKVSGYYALLTEVLENASVDKKELTDEQQEIADDLAMIQYDLTQGKKYISQYEDFFELAK